jgi:putative FmdB family regulatory protein
MPLYEYRCLSCDAQFQSLIMKKEQENEIVCPKCSGRKIKKLISRVASHVSERDRLDSFDPGKARGDSFYRDSRNIGLSAKKRAQEMGVDLGSGFEERLEKLRSDPGSVIRDSE